MRERTKILLLVSGFVAEGLFLLKDYARQHVLLCLVPAFVIAGAIGQFVTQGAVMRYLGASASRPVAYGVASVSGSVLAVCSCTVLPLFASIYRRGAGLGPATSFLYSGPAINVLAMILTARVLGLELGIARTVGAVSFAFVIGLMMALLFRSEWPRSLRDGGRGIPALVVAGRRLPRHDDRGARARQLGRAQRQRRGLRRDLRHPLAPDPRRSRRPRRDDVALVLEGRAGRVGGCDLGFAKQITPCCSAGSSSPAG